MELERIHELMDQLAEEIQKVYPKATDAAIRLDDDGYRGITIHQTKRESDVPSGAWKRRVLLDHSRVAGEWTRDRSSEQNDYYRWMNELLEEE